VQPLTLKALAHNYVSTLTVVDFDAVERWKPGTIPIVLRPFLHGKQTIGVDYQFSGGQFENHVRGGKGLLRRRPPTRVFCGDDYSDCRRPAAGTLRYQQPAALPLGLRHV
jgi:hypothetical protein